jgi:hypothetical protein
MYNFNGNILILVPIKRKFINSRTRLLHIAIHHLANDLNYKKRRRRRMFKQQHQKLLSNDLISRHVIENKTKNMGFDIYAIVFLN